MQPTKAAASIMLLNCGGYIVWALNPGLLYAWHE
jgi:hypothetical protein